jgi:hypothetical protein
MLEIALNQAGGISISSENLFASLRVSPGGEM